MITNEMANMKVAPVLNAKIGNIGIGASPGKSAVVRFNADEDINPTKKASELEYTPMVDRVKSNSNQQNLNIIA